MIERLKKLWDESGTKEFWIKYLFPVIGLFFTLGLLGNLYTQTLTINDLVKTTGTVESIGVIFEQGIKQQSNSYPLIIRINDNETQFRIFEHFKWRFSKLQSQVELGDTITIYSRSQFQAMVGWGRVGDIFEICEGKNVLFDITWMKNYVKDQVSTLVFFSLFFWGIYTGFKIKWQNEKKATANKMHVS